MSTAPAQNLAVQTQIQKDLSVRYNANIPLVITVLDEHSVKLHYWVHVAEFNEFDPINYPNSIPSEYFDLYCGRGKDWKPQFTFSPIPYQGIIDMQVWNAKDDIEELIKKNNRFYGGNRIRSAKTAVDENGFTVEITFG